MNERELRNQIVTHGQYLSSRGYSPGTSGNLSARLGDGYLMTPTNSSLVSLDPDQLSRLDASGHHIDGDKPSKEVIVHLAMYHSRPAAGAVVHLHSPYCMAVSCLDGLDPDNALPPLTPYYIMRIGRLPLVPYFKPGDTKLAEAAEKRALDSHALLFAHHGMIVCGHGLNSAIASAEELEETARLYLLLKGQPYRQLSATQVAELEEAFPRNI
jgi:ribulose-5-phosphate 4-epimerase/fuculose-1-phosphate aldolase